MPCCSYMCSCHHLCSTCCSSLLSFCHPRPLAMCLISRPSRSHDWVAWPNSSSLCSEREILTGILHQERYAIPVSTARSGKGVGGGRFLSAQITPSDINLGHFCISLAVFTRMEALCWNVWCWELEWCWLISNQPSLVCCQSDLWTTPTLPERVPDWDFVWQICCLSCLFPHPSFCNQIDHIALIIELLGSVPRKLIMAGKYSKDFFTKKGKRVTCRGIFPSRSSEPKDTSHSIYFLTFSH